MITSHHKSILLPVFLLLLSIACSPLPDPKQEVYQGPLSFLQNNPQLDRELDSLVNHELVPFVYARIEYEDGNLIYEHGSVNQNLYPELTLNQDSWFRIWSMSKIVTISLAMDLVEEGTISLDDAVRQYIPEFADLKVAVAANGQSIALIPWDQTDQICPISFVPMESIMTIRHLINHEAGFYYPWTNISCLDSIWKAQNLNASTDSDDLIKRLAKMPLVQQAGTAYYYGLNTTVLGLVLERATGHSLKQLVEERITKPTGIQGLQYTRPEGISLVPRTRGGDSMSKVTAANAFAVLGTELPSYAADHPLYLGGEGMLASTDGYADFARLLLKRGALNGYRLLGDSTIEEMAAPHTQLDNPWGYNGYNLWVTGDTLKELKTGEGGLWVGGGYEGTYFWIDRKRKFVGLVMTQMFEMKTAPSEVFRTEVYQQLWKHEGEKE